MSGYALRIKDTWPHSKGHPGDVILHPFTEKPWDTAEELEYTRSLSSNAEHYEVVAVDDAGRVIA